MHAISGHETAQELDEQLRSGTGLLLARAALARFLSRFESGALAREELTAIADLLECEAVSYEPRHEGEIATVLFLLSTPECNGELDGAMAKRCRRLLGSLGSAHADEA